MSFYTSRKDKPEWLLREFPDIFKQARQVLDIGCDQKKIASLLPAHISYTGLDIIPEADIQWNLDSGVALPIKDKEYDLVLCLETLEHLEQIHFIFDQLCRVGSRYILITLPNPISRIFFSYLLGRKCTKKEVEQRKFGAYMKFYGLPFDRPFDRHRWFFNTEESVSFVAYRAKLNGWKVRDIFYSLDTERGLKKYLKFLLAGFGKKRMYNFFNETTVFLLEKDVL